MFLGRSECGEVICSLWRNRKTGLPNLSAYKDYADGWMTTSMRCCGMTSRVKNVYDLAIRKNNDFRTIQNTLIYLVMNSKDIFLIFDCSLTANNV